METNMEMIPNMLMDGPSLTQFYALLFRTLLAISGGGAIVALAGILRLLLFDEMPAEANLRHLHQ